MKTLITVITMMVLTITFSVAYADEVLVFGSNKDIGTLLYEDAFAAHDRIMADKGEISSAAGGDEIPVFGSNKDIGTVLYEDAFAANDKAMAYKEERGAAAGGLVKEDESARIWDTLFGPVGGSDLP